MNPEFHEKLASTKKTTKNGYLYAAFCKKLSKNFAAQ